MADASDIAESVMIMILGCSLSLFMTRFGGETIDRMISGFMEAGVYDVTAIWQSSNIEVLTDLFYVVCMIPAALSIVVAFLRTQKKTEQDTAMYMQDDVSQFGGEYR